MQLKFPGAGRARRDTIMRSGSVRCVAFFPPMRPAAYRQDLARVASQPTTHLVWRILPPSVSRPHATFRRLRAGLFVLGEGPPKLEVSATLLAAAALFAGLASGAVVDDGADALGAPRFLALGEASSDFMAVAPELPKVVAETVGSGRPAPAARSANSSQNAFGMEGNLSALLAAKVVACEAVLGSVEAARKHCTPKQTQAASRALCRAARQRATLVDVSS